MRGVDEHGGLDLQPRIGAQRADAQARRDDPHLADAGVRENGLGVALHGAHEGAEKRCAQTGADQHDASGRHRRLPERQEPDPAEQPCLDHRAAQYRAGGNRGRGMRQRQPEVQCQGPGLDAEADQQEQMRRPAEYGAAKLRDLRGARARDQEDEPAEDQHLAQHGEREVDPARAHGLRVAAVHHQTGRGQSQQGEAEVEGGNVAGQDQAEVARHRQQQKGYEAGGVGIRLQVAGGIPRRRQVERAGEAQEHPPGLIQGQHRVLEQPGNLQTAARTSEQRQRQGRQRGQGGEGSSALAQPRRSERHGQGQRQRHHADQRQRLLDAGRTHGPYSLAVMILAQASGLKGASASTPASRTIAAVNKGGSSSIQCVSQRPKSRSCGHGPGGDRNQAR